MLGGILRRRAGGTDPLDDTLRRMVAELTAGREWGTAPLKESPTARQLLDAAPDEQIAATLAAMTFPARGVEREIEPHRVEEACRELLRSLLRRKLPWDEQTLGALLDALVQRGRRRPHGAGLNAGAYGDPVKAVLGVIERHTDGGPAPESLRERLERVRRFVGAGYVDGEDRKAIRRLDALLDEQASGAGPLVAAGDQWARGLLEARSALPDAERAAAERLLAAATLATATKPSRAFTAARDELVGELGAARVGELTGGLLAAAARVGPDKRFGQVPPETGDALRGLCWLAAAGGGDPAARGLAAMALAGWKKVPEYGPLCKKAANAAIAALAELPEGAPQLGRIRAQLKQPAAVSTLDAAIDAAAERIGVPRAEFEERVVPHFDLDEHGRRAVALGDYTAELDAAGGLRFRTGAGKALKSVPAPVKAEHGPELAALKQTAKDVKAMAAAQKSRLERLLLDDRAWTFANWEERYLRHGLVGPLARRLIWVVDGTAAIHHEGGFVTCTGAPLASPGPGATVRLWHPVDADPDEVKAWRRFLEEREITQPFKQAHREVYLITPAELETGTYSNRFAAHILRQHQMAALARGRGWRYALQGAWDAADEQAVLQLPQHQLSASFWVERPWDSEDWSESGVFNHVLSDQVRFHSPTTDPVPLATIPPRVFSEVMRDVDLFVGVTSIGNDPTWADQGERHYQEYWRHYAFGELTEQAAVRRDLLERLLPKLVIAGVADLDGRFLRVRGKRRTYKIHLGSANILMEPNDQYLCIVPGRAAEPPSRVFLPFEGDQGLAVILSKAFLLAKDDAITDPTINAQIDGR